MMSLLVDQYKSKNVSRQTNYCPQNDCLEHEHIWLSKHAVIGCLPFDSLLFRKSIAKSLFAAVSFFGAWVTCITKLAWLAFIHIYLCAPVISGAHLQRRHHDLQKVSLVVYLKIAEMKIGIYRWKKVSIYHIQNGICNNQN